jgi:CBS domain-containing protein
MSATPAQLQSQTIELAARSFEAFGGDIACMLGLDITGKETSARDSTLAQLKKEHRKLVAVGSVQSHGLIVGTWHILLDQEAFFTLAGILVVQPENVIIKNRKQGVQETADELKDAIGEVGNLMIGSFDRIFREECHGHGHFVYSNTFVGQPWNKPEVFGLGPDDELIAVSYEMAVGTFPPFTVSAIFAKKIFEPQSEHVQLAAASVAEEQKPAEAGQVAPIAVAAEPAPEQVAPATAAPEPAIEKPAEEPVRTSDEKPGVVFESIQKMTQSPATLPGEEAPQSPALPADTKAKAVMRNQLAWASPDDTVEQILAVMDKARSDYVLISSAGQPTGIVSRGDARAAISPFLRASFSRFKRPLDSATLRIRARCIMTAPLKTLDSESSVRQVVELMLKDNIGAVALTNGQAVSGIISSAEILSWLAGHPVLQ